VGKALRSLLRKRKKIVEYILVVLLLSAGILAYFLVQKSNTSNSALRPDIFDRNLRDALNYYRLEEYDRCEMLLKHVLDQAGRRRTKSLAALYLGNIYFKKNDFEKALTLYRDSVSYDRKNVNALFNSAVALSETGRWTQSLERVQKALELQPDFRKGLLFLGNLYYAAGQFDMAEQMYTRKQEDPVFLFNLAMVYGRINRRDESIKLLSGLASSPDAPEALRGAAAYECAVLMQKKDTYGSVQYLKKATALFPDSPAVQYNLACTLMKTAQFSEAADILKAFTANPDYSKRREYVSLYSFALVKSGRYQDALNFIVRSHTQNGDELTAQIAGDIFLELGDLTQAQIYYREAIEKETIEKPVDQNAYVNLVQIYLHQGSYERAIAVSDEFEKRYPDSVRPLICRADVLFSLGDVKNARMYVRQVVEGNLVLVGDLYRKHGLYDNALDLYGRAVAEKPENMKVWEKIAETYMTTGHTERARSIYKKIQNAAIDPVWYYRSAVILAGMEEGESARPLYEELIRDFPYRYEAYYNLALLLLKNGEYAEALSFIKECLEKNPGLAAPVLAKLHTLSGVTYIFLNRFEDASRAFAAARTLDSNNFEVVQYMEILENYAR